VTDLQGIQAPDGSFLLTDPVVLCWKDPSRFSAANRGRTEDIEERIKSVFMTVSLMAWRTKLEGAARLPPTNVQRARFDMIAKYVFMIHELHL
jgi:hypothetical protein